MSKSQQVSTIIFHLCVIINCFSYNCETLRNFQDNEPETDLSNNSRLVDIFTISPTIQAALLLQVCEVDVSAWNQALIGQIFYQI